MCSCTAWCLINRLELRITVYFHIFRIYFIFDLFREGCPSTEVVFQGALQNHFVINFFNEHVDVHFCTIGNRYIVFILL